MFPNPQDALPIPPCPNPQHYKKRAKELLKAFRSPNPDALRSWCADWLNSLMRLSAVIAPDTESGVDHSIADHSIADHWIADLENFARAKLSPTGSLSAAQFVIARAHGFESWPKFAKHITVVSRRDSPVSHFELAADAVVSGDLPTLQTLLREHPNLIRARSARRHQATLLHYVSANGVENYRQKTPANIIPIAAFLLHAGAEVDASADVYGGSTTLGLVATSSHPERAGVQTALLDLLLHYGASLNAPGPGIINVCLANGRAAAAQFLSQRAATLDLEAAAGVGRLDLVKTFFNQKSFKQRGDLLLSATNHQMERGFLWACEYGRVEVVDFLLRSGVSLQARSNTGQTALHWAVVGGQLGIVKMLLAAGADLEAKNTYSATPLGQALWSVLREPEPEKSAGQTSDEKKAAEKNTGEDNPGEKELFRKMPVDGQPEAKDSSISRSAPEAGESQNFISIIETLLLAGARIEPGTLAWITQQKSCSPSLKQRTTELLKRYGAS